MWLQTGKVVRSGRKKAEIEFDDSEPSTRAKRAFKQVFNNGQQKAK